MDGVHDLGGVEGFGSVAVEMDEPIFHEPWEARVFALASAGMTRGLYGTPVFRHAIERMPPAQYMTASYYERWLTATATLLIEHGVIERLDLERAGDGEFPLSGPATAVPIDDPGEDVSKPRFGIGDLVRVSATGPRGHTRCPRYARGHRGEVVRYDGPCNFDDVEAHAPVKRREPLYAVRFSASELWGAGSDPASSVTVDLFDTYLEAP